MALILGFPANEIVMPIILMAYLSTGELIEISNVTELRNILVANGWTITTALCTMIIFLIHWPCSTTCLTIKKETGGLMPLLVMFIMMMFSAMGTEFIKGKAMDVINDIVPTSQMMLLNLMNVDPHPIRHILYSLLTSVIFFVSGYAIFKNSDLN